MDRARRRGVGDAGGVEPACTDAPDGAPPPRGTQRRTRHRRMTTVSSTSSFCRRRRRRRLLGRQAAGRGTTFGAGCAARRAASAPSPPHRLHSTRAHSAPSVGRCTGTSWPDLGVRAQLLRNGRASRRAAKAACAQVEGKWRGNWAPLRPPTRLEPAAAGRRAEQGEAAQIFGRTHELKGVRASTLKRLLRSPFSGSPGFHHLPKERTTRVEIA